MESISRRRFGAIATGGLMATGTLAAAPAPARAEDAIPPNVVVFAEPTIQHAVKDITAPWRARTETPIDLFGTRSDVMIQQRVRGARCDVLIATRETMDRDAVPAKLVAPGSRFDLWRNRLVLAGRAPGKAPITLGPTTDLLAMLGAGRLAIADAAVAPAGVAAEAVLEKLGFRSKLQGRIQGAESSPGAAFLVSTGAAPLGLIYASDVAADPSLAVVATVPDELYEPTVYAIALMQGVVVPGAALLSDYLRSAEAAQRLAANGLAPA
ncbi:MAG TPA: molybdate ABC transporter substrate-binding protein [Alphaproteobacteria bacterium]|nr:molybdate ABC transporter substrate-binding protein [Alphaproteobacteria bacterium]